MKKFTPDEIGAIAMNYIGADLIQRLRAHKTISEDDVRAWNRYVSRLYPEQQDGKDDGA